MGDLTDGALRARFSVLLIAAALIFGVKYLILMNGGFLYGRLTVPPPYDDVAYFVDGMQRLRVFQDGGLWRLVQDLWANPPHSPYSSLAALVGFLLAFGDVSAPYAVNALTAAAICALLARSFQWPLLWSCIVFAFATSLPWFDHLVTVFHPDLLAGFAGAVIGAILLWQDRTLTTRRGTAAVGVAAGLALLIKPVAIPMIGLLYALAFLFGAAIARLKEKTWSQVAMRLVVGAAAVLMVAGPYFVKHAVAIVNYLYAGFVTERETWAALGAGQDKFLFFVNVSNEYFKVWALLGLGLCAMLAVALVLARRRAAAGHYMGLLALVGVAYIVPTMSPVKVPVFGGFLYGFLFVTIVLVARVLYESARAAAANAAAAPAWAAVIPAALLIGGAIQFSDAQLRFPRQTAIESMRLYDDVYRIAKDYERTLLLAGENRPVVVYFPSPLGVATHALQFRGLQEGIRVEPVNSPHEKTLEPLQEQATRADIVVVPDDDVLKTAYPYPVNAQIGALRTWLASNNRLRFVREIVWNGGRMSIYVAERN